MKTIDALNSSPLSIQEFVLSRYGYEITNNRHVMCPFCNEKKFRIGIWKNAGQYAGICVCGSYPLIKLAEHRSGKTGKEFLDEIDELIGNKQDDYVPPKKPKALESAEETFRRGVTILRTEAHTYLLSRGITYVPQRHCRYVESVDYWDDGVKVGTFNAIYTLLTDDLGRPIKTHTTYLDKAAKARIDKPRKLLSLTEFTPSIAARITPPAQVIGVGEGLESCLSFTEITRIPCWPTMNTANLKNFMFDDFVRHGYIAADNDHNGAGMAAAFACAHSNILRRPNLEKITILCPSQLGHDFNDALINSGKIEEFLVCKKPK